MKAGFFFQNLVDLDLIKEISKRNNLDLMGVYFEEKNQEEENSPLVFKSPEELLVQVQVAFIFLKRENYFQIAAKALKRGVNVFLSNLSDCTAAELLDLNQLSFEIGVPIGFGFSGASIIKQDEIVGNYFMLQLTRDSGNVTDDDAFYRMLVYDVASFVRIKPFGLKKLRVNSLPLFCKSPKAINLRLEYDNSSIIASCITRVDEPERCMLRFFSGNDGYFKELSCNSSLFSSEAIDNPHILLTDNDYMANLEEYVQQVQNRNSLSFGVDNAIEVLSIIESINDKVSPMN